MYSNLIDFIFYTKYFIYFIFFLVVLFNNLISLSVFGNSNKLLIKLLYFSININGCVLIKFVQWIFTNINLIDENEYIINLFNKFYENCNIHNLNYTKKIFYNDYGYQFDSFFKIDKKFKIKSGSIAQIYKVKLKNKNLFNTDIKNIAIKIVHPEIKYQMFFPIKFIKLYKYFVTNINCLKKYDTIFNFDSFFKNLKSQSDMINEYHNMKYFYEHYTIETKNPYIVIPKPLSCSENILIMEYNEGKSIDEYDISNFEKQKIIVLLNMFVKDNYMFLDRYHCDLHDANWKIKKYNDFYQLVIYDFGYVIKNNLKETIKKFIYYTDLDDLNNSGKILYNNINNIDISEEQFLKNFEIYLQSLYPYADKFINTVYKFCYDNKYSLKDNMLESFISMILMKKHFVKYIFKSTNDDQNYNHLIKTNIMYNNFCKEYDIFHNLSKHFEDYYLNNEKIIKKYNYQNDNFDTIDEDNELIDI